MKGMFSLSIHDSGVAHGLSNAEEGATMLIVHLKFQQKLHSSSFVICERLPWPMWAEYHDVQSSSCPFGSSGDFPYCKRDTFVCEKLLRSSCRPSPSL